MGEIFERTKPATALEWTGERFTSGVTGQIEIEHLHRYFMARELCRGLDVVDVASGEGYGSALLAQTARSVVGVDVSDAAVQHARQAYIGANLQYVQGDARRIPLEDNSVDVAVSFETIEHFYDHDAFLAEIRRILRPGGRFIVSSPERDVYSPSGSAANEYHVRELSGAEFYALLRQTFDHVRMLAQRPMIGSALFSAQSSDSTTTFEKRGPHHFEACSGLPRPLYLVAIASDHQVLDIPNSVYIESSDIEVALSAAESIAEIIAANATLKASAEAAETARASAAALLDRAVAEAEQQAEAHRAQMLEMDRASHAHALRASMLEDKLTESIAKLETVESAHSKAVLEFRIELEAARQEAVIARTDAELAQSEAAAARQQRDMARVGALRAASKAEGAWRFKLEELERQAAEAESLRLSEMEVLLQKAADAEQQAAEWRLHYERLRAKLDIVLRRFLIYRLSRLIPKPLRRFAREKLLSGESR